MVVFYVVKIFGCKTVQVCVKRGEGRMAATAGEAVVWISRTQTFWRTPVVEGAMGGFVARRARETSLGHSQEVWGETFNVRI
jgi:hypothetical protein